MSIFFANWLISFQMAMMRESEESTASLLAVKKKFNSSEDAITLFLARVLANLTQVMLNSKTAYVESA